jgi:hypothetical protein
MEERPRRESQIKLLGWAIKTTDELDELDIRQ